MLGVGFGSLFMGNAVKFGFVFKLVGAFLFFALGMMMNAEYDVAYTVTTSDPDGAGPLTGTTELRYIVGDGEDSSSSIGSWVGWLFIGLALLWVGLFFMDVMGNHWN